MYEYRGLYDVFFIALYIGTAMFALLAAVYLLLRRVNAFMGEEVHSSMRLRHWTAGLLVAMTASHVWWYAIGIYWLADDRLVRNITNILLDHMTLVPLVIRQRARQASQRPSSRKVSMPRL